MKNEVLDRVQLADVLLESITVTRGPGNRDQPEQINHGYGGELTWDDEFFHSIVALEVTIVDHDEEKIADIAVDYRLIYAIAADAPEWEENEARDVGRASVTDAAPFLRETLSDLLAKMGLPPYTLPLVRSDSLL